MLRKTEWKASRLRLVLLGSRCCVRHGVTIRRRIAVLTAAGEPPAQVRSAEFRVSRRPTNVPAS